MFIYGLLDEHGELRYVGKTIRALTTRLVNHLTPYHLRASNHKNCWLKGMISRGFGPTIIKIQELNYSYEELDKAEVYWIESFKDNGCRLTNSTVGGEGAPGCPQSKETRDKRAASLRDRKRPWSAMEAAMRFNDQKKIKLIDNLGNVYESINDAARKLNVGSGRIWALIKLGQPAKRGQLKGISIFKYEGV